MRGMLNAMLRCRRTFDGMENIHNILDKNNFKCYVQYDYTAIQGYEHKQNKDWKKVC